MDQVHLPGKERVESKSAQLGMAGVPIPVGTIATDAYVGPALEWAEELLQFAPVCEWLREAYTDHDGYRATLASGMGRLLSRVFAEQGLVVMDGAERVFHSLGQDVLRSAIERAEELDAALLERSAELERAG